MNKVYLLLGSNMGNPAELLATAREKISEQLGEISRTSSIYQTAAWGKTDQPDFLNQVVVLHSALSAESCLQTILQIEEKMGRTRTVKNAPRVIDIDILYYGKQAIDLPHLIVPHPAIQDRQFVLIPLNEISPLFIHPKLKKTNHQLLIDCKDPLNVKKI